MRATLCCGFPLYVFLSDLEDDRYILIQTCNIVTFITYYLSDQFKTRAIVTKINALVALVGFATYLGKALISVLIAN